MLYGTLKSYQYLPLINSISPNTYSNIQGSLKHRRAIYYKEFA